MNCDDDSLLYDGGCDTNSRHSAYTCEVGAGTLQLTHRSLRQFVHSGMYSGYLFCDKSTFDQTAHTGLSTKPCDYCTGQ